MAIVKEIERVRRLGLPSYAQYRRRRFANRLLRMANLIGPRSHQCPCCGWSGAHFLNHVREGGFTEGVVCMRCRSRPRHRGLALYLKRLLPALGPNAAVLHVAPERALERILAGRAQFRYFGIDLGPRARSARADITAIPFRSAAFDLVIASHVLEHVQAEAAALREIARVTKPGGRVLLMVPMVERWENRETVEFGRADPAREGHWRIYGYDFVARPANAGLRCEAVDFPTLIEAEQLKRYGVGEGPIFVCEKPV